MKLSVSSIKQKLSESISHICEVPKRFSRKTGVYFTRDRKLPLRDVISCLLSMEGKSLTPELLRYFGCSADIASSSAFVQQRGKIGDDAFPTLFSLFVRKTDSPSLYKGLRLLSADGSDIQIPTNPAHTDSYYPGANGQAPYSLIHLDAVYDLLQHTYTDVTLTGKRIADERGSLCKMIDKSQLGTSLIIADRGYESYNLMAHIQEKGWYYLIRIKDTLSENGIAKGLRFPESECFDMDIDLKLTTRQTREVKKLCADRNQYRFIPANNAFDYLPRKNRRHDPVVFYHLPFRIVRFKITDDTYETVVTNLDKYNFPAAELKKLYNMRWGIETSFRELKYTLGLLHFHAKKVEYIYQEIFARLIMYNFTELITSHVIIQKTETEYAYKANFSVAVHICRQFFLGNVSPPNVEALIQKFVSPIRTGRSRPRIITGSYAVSFTYRVA